MPRRLFALVLLAALPAPALAQLPPDKALATLKAGDGLQVELFASEPMLLNPTSMDIDHLGRVWVCEAVNYRRKNFGRPILRQEGDRVVILTDTNADGKADDSTVFYQGADLMAPLGIAVAKDATGAGYKVFVCQSPDILLFEDKDGDARADGPPKKFLTGFQGIDHDHGVHSVLIGPDGKLYFTVGDAGVKGLQSSDGQGRKWETNKTDCQAGTVWRCDFDGTNLELIAHNFRNNYECCVNSFGDVWLSDNDDDGNQQTRICHVMPGGNYGYWPRGPGQTHWHEEQPGVVHKTLRTGFGSPTGICFYEGSLLPKQYHGQLLHTDAGPRELRAFHIQPKGAGYELTKEDLLTSTDNWFRPSDVCVAPDGSVFVCDWYDPGVGGHGMGDWTRGRVYRVTPKGHQGYKVPAVKLDTPMGMMSALASPCLATRFMGHQAIIRAKGGDWAVELLGQGSLRDANPGFEPWPFARMFWIRALSKPGTTPEYFEKFWDTADQGAKWYASRYPDGQKGEVIERYRQPFYAQTTRIGKLLRREKFADAFMIESKFGPIRSPAFYVSFQVDQRSAAEYLVELRDVVVSDDLKSDFWELAKWYKGQDHFYRAALNIACGTDPKRRDAILADFDKHFPEWNDKVADLVWELRPKSILPRLTQLLADPKLSAAQKGRIVDILAVNDDPAAGKALLALLSGDQPAEVTARALENLRLFLPTKWNALAKSDDLQAAATRLLNEPKTRVSGLHLVAAAHLTAAIDEVAAITREGESQLEVRVEAIRTLGRLPHPKAVAALVQQAEAAAPRSTEAVAALGAQITGQGKGGASQQALAALQDITTSKETPAELKRAAVAALAGTRPGTDWLLKLKEDGKMPEAVAADAGRLLRNSPFQGQRNKALLLFPAPGKIDLAKLPPISELAKRTGNADRGREIMAKSLTGEAQCLKCHTINGTGGQIGPDLSLIGKKGSRENLFESILQPSKAIDDQHVTWRVDTEDGQSVVGLLVQETDSTITVRDANGKDHKLPAKGSEKRKQPLSLMPDNLATVLTEDELVDLVEYLATLR